MSIVSFSLVNWILSVVMGCSLGTNFPCLFDLLELCSCRRGNLPDDGFSRLAVSAGFCILGSQRAIHDVGQRFHDRIIGRKLVKRFEIPDGQLAVRQHFDNVYDHGRIDILANRSRRLQCLKETGRVHLGIHLGEEVVSLAEIVADHAPASSAISLMVVLSYPNRMMTAAAASRICCWRSLVSDMHGLSFRHLSHIAHIMIHCAAYHEMWAEVKAEIRSTLLQVVLTMMIINMPKEPDIFPR